MVHFGFRKQHAKALIQYLAKKLETAATSLDAHEGGRPKLPWVEEFAGVFEPRTLP